jgi:iron complex transport system substrate-binding protein
LIRRSFLSGLAAVLAGCGGKPPSSPTRPRVVSLSPSTTEAVFAIGAGHLLVGRSRFCDHPKEVDSLPSVGGFADPNIEAILGLSPTLIVGARGPAGPGLEERLKAHGLDTYFPETESFAQIGAMLLGLGGKLGRSAEATVTANRIDLMRKAVTTAAKDLPAPRTVMLFDTGPIVVAGPGGFPDEMLRLARAENVITEGGAYPTIGLERLVALDPDVLLDGATAGVEGASALAAKRDAPGWKALRAFANGRVHPLSSAVLRPGPRIGDGLRELARAVHGSAIKLK